MLQILPVLFVVDISCACHLCCICVTFYNAVMDLWFVGVCKNFHIFLAVVSAVVVQD